MEELIILDTGILIDFLTDGPTASETESILKASQAGISSVTVFELFNGVIGARHLEQREQLVSLCRTLDITAAVARTASDIYTALKTAGSLIDNEDILTGACALEHGAPVFTLNRKHFERINGLLLYN